MSRISALINTRNESDNLRYCLETLKWCDELVVVDMSSSDGTADIAREYTDKVFSVEEMGYVEPARKTALEKASGDWLLVVDADEMLPQSLVGVLREITARNDTDLVEIPFTHYIMGVAVNNSGWGESWSPRFFRRGKAEFSGEMHGVIRGTAGARVLRLKHSPDNCIAHFNYLDSAHFIEKLNRYTAVEAGQLYKQGKTFSYYRLVKGGVSEFYWRFIRRKGFKDGPRGFAICLMMAFYRALTFIKLWEKHESRDSPVSERYKKLRESILAGWGK